MSSVDELSPSNVQNKQAAVEKIQQMLVEHRLDVYLVPSSDAHYNEFVPACWQRRAWLSGFNGSAGDLLILKDRVVLWTDSRYSLQAKSQMQWLSADIEMHVQSNMGSMADWFVEHNYLQVGVDPSTITIATHQVLEQKLLSAKGQLHALVNNWVDAVWEDQPAAPMQPVKVWQWASKGESAKDKCARVRDVLAEKNIDALCLSKLDDIAWLLNIRGADVEYSPLCISYVCISEAQVIWFVDEKKCSSALKAYCRDQSIELKPYNAIAAWLQAFSGRLWLDPMVTSWYVQMLVSAATLVFATSPIVIMKACKDDIEISGMRLAHHSDAIALVQFFMWLESNWQQGVDEYQAAMYLAQCRLEAPGNQGLSFESISSFAENGAVIHYAPSEITAKTITDDSLYLLDSGGQYEAGTTDVTRVIHLGEPTPQQRLDYTSVLQGHIDCARVIFPKGTSGAQLDVLARQYLWRRGLNYGHGTGHGVGCYLCVHEGPQGISPRSHMPFELGMVVSNEPGLYREGEYGIRLENCQLVVEADVPVDDRLFYAFETLTLFPYERNLIDVSLLTDEQLKWLDEYHQRVYHALSEQCDEDMRQWLLEKTQPLA